MRPSSDVEIYRFAHSVLKDTAYASMLKRTRATIHERFVDWAEPVNRERGRELEFEEILGYHLEQAYRYRLDLGAIDDTAARSVVGHRRSWRRLDGGHWAAVTCRPRRACSSAPWPRVPRMIRSVTSWRPISGSP